MKFFTPHCPDILNTVPLSKGLLADLERFVNNTEYIDLSESLSLGCLHLFHVL